MEKLAAANKSKLIDYLTERLTFERSGVKLYDQVIKKIQASPLPQFQQLLGDLTEHRNEEKEHEEWLEAQVRSLGGDAHGQTELSQLVTRESQGIEAVIMGDAQIPHLLHALLAAELVDNAGWDLLVELADEVGDHEARREFKKRLHEEEDHLKLVRQAVEDFALDQVIPDEQRV